MKETAEQKVFLPSATMAFTGVTKASSMTTIDQDTLDAMQASGELINIKRFNCGGLAVVCKFTYNYAILADLGELGYGRRWCYHDRMATLCALDDWDDFSASPDGWHRETHTGARRETTDSEAS